MINDIIKVKGRYEFFNVDTKETKVFDNLVVQGFFTNIFKAMKGETFYLQVKDFATGSGTNAAIKSDTTLQTEYFRKAISSINYNTTQCVIKTTLAPSESNITIKEVGIFDTNGGLISRANVNIEKNASTQYIVTYTMTIV